MQRVKPQTVFLLSDRHQSARLKWCRINKNRDFSNMVFSDEASFQFCSNHGKVLVKFGEVPTIGKPKYSPRVMVFGAFSLRGSTPLVFIKKLIDSVVYSVVVETTVLPTMSQLYPDGFVYQQDNARPRTSKYTRAYLERLGFCLIDWPANSPDIILSKTYGDSSSIC